MPAPLIAAAPAVAAASPWVTGGLMAGASLLGSGISSAFNMAQSSKQMKFQERMSSTAHQREVIDLRKAGLNPLLSASHGGASAPAGSAAQMTENPGVAALNAAQMKANLELIQAQTRDVNAAAQLKGVTATDIMNQMGPRITDATAAANLKGMTATDIANKMQAAIEQIRAQTGHTQQLKEKERLENISRKVQKKPWEILDHFTESTTNSAKSWFDKNVKDHPSIQQLGKQLRDSFRKKRPGASGRW